MKMNMQYYADVVSTFSKAVLMLSISVAVLYSAFTYGWFLKTMFGVA